MTALLIALLLSCPTDDLVGFDSDLDGECLYFDKVADPNTYICRSGADEITVTVGGVAELVCDASYCTFASGPMVGASIPFADAAGTLTLKNVDALDATTETTIEAAIDTLGTVTFDGLTFVNPSTSTVTANAATCDFASYDICKVDLQGATGTVTITLSNGRVTGNLIEITQGTQLGDVAFSPGLYAAGGVGHTAVTATDDAVDWVFLSYDGTNYVLLGQQQDIKVVP